MSLHLLEARKANNKYSMQGCQQLMSLLCSSTQLYIETRRTPTSDVLHTYTCLWCTSTESSRRQRKRIFTLPLSAGRLSEITVSGDKINKPAKQRAASLFISWSGKKRELGKGYVFIYKWFYFTENLILKGLRILKSAVSFYLLQGPKPSSFSML